MTLCLVILLFSIVRNTNIILLELRGFEFDIP